MASSGRHIVKRGETIGGIARSLGYHWKSLWDHNAALRELRDNPNVLQEGDILELPVRSPRTKTGEVGTRHRFRRIGQLSPVRVRMLSHGRARAGVNYHFEVEGREPQTGKTTEDGVVEVLVPANASVGLLRLDTDHGSETFRLRLGELDPVTEPLGVQQRLRNLHIKCPLSGKDDDATRRAVAQFQAGHEDLESNGDLGDAGTQRRLVEVHGS